MCSVLDGTFAHVSIHMNNDSKRANRTLFMQVIKILETRGELEDIYMN